MTVKILSRLSGSSAIDQNIIFTVLIRNIKAVWPTKIAMMFLCFLDSSL